MDKRNIIILIVAVALVGGIIYLNQPRIAVYKIANQAPQQPVNTDNSSSYIGD